jgi:hypothetical protein
MGARFAVQSVHMFAEHVGDRPWGLQLCFLGPLGMPSFLTLVHCTGTCAGHVQRAGYHCYWCPSSTPYALAVRTAASVPLVMCMWHLLSLLFAAVHCWSVGGCT